MSLLQAIKRILCNRGRASTDRPDDVREGGDLPAQPGPVDHMAVQSADTESAAELLSKKYGSDFNRFYYRPGIDNVLRQQIVPFRYPNDKYQHFLDYDYWQEKHAFNFPGPFYTGESDTCGTGDVEAPANVMYDEYCREFIFRQPRDFTELLCTMNAAAVETLDSYSCNGNHHWTYALCREWWEGRDRLIAELDRPALREANGVRARLYIDYLNGEAEMDLRRYCYFLEHGKYPSKGNTELPVL